MAYTHINDLEEQLRQDRRLGKARRRKRRLRRLIPVFLLIAIGVGVYFLTRNNEAAPPPTAPPSPETATVTISFVGDISLDRAAIDHFRTGSDFDFTPLFQRILPRLVADLTVGNLEGNIVTPDRVGDHDYPAALLRDLYSAGFDVLQTANSYSIQNGITGLNATREAVRAAGMDPLGTWGSAQDREDNEVLIREVNGMRIAFLAFTKGMNNLRLPDGAEYCVDLLYTDYDTNYSKIARSTISSAVQKAKLMSPDVIIALVHWGSEYDREIADSQKEIASLLFDQGVNLIVGSHSHYVGPMEFRSHSITPFGGSFIAYSLGDFVSTADTSTARNGCVLNVTIQKDGDGVRILDLSYAPSYSAAPSEDLGLSGYEVLDSLDAISFYESGYYDRISEKLYDRLVTAVEKMKEQTGLGEQQAAK